MLQERAVPFLGGLAAAGSLGSSYGPDRDGRGGQSQARGGPDDGFGTPVAASGVSGVYAPREASSTGEREVDVGAGFGIDTHTSIDRSSNRKA